MSEPPVIILVETTLPENLGGVARVLANFGVRELRLVAPEVSPADPQARAVATHGLGVLEAAREYRTLAEAVADLRQVWGTTALERVLEKPVAHPRELVPRLVAAPGPVGLVFGPERTGLRTEHLALMDGWIQLPTDPACRSLNLAQAVGILAWEWSCAVAPPASGRVPIPATRAEAIGMVEELERTLVAFGAYPEPALRARAFRNLRGAFLRAGFTGAEVRSLRGAWKILGRKA